MKQGTRFLAVAVPLALSYWLLQPFFPQSAIGEFVADIRLVMALLAGMLFLPLAVTAIRAPVFAEQEAFVVAICTTWLAIGATGVYSLLAREFLWPMTAATSPILGFFVFVSFLAATLHASSLLRDRSRWLVLAAAGLGLVLAIAAWAF